MIVTIENISFCLELFAKAAFTIGKAGGGGGRPPSPASERVSIFL